MSNFLDQLYEVLLRRTPFNIRPRRFARLHDLTTMSNSIDQPSDNKVELHRPTVCQQCRTPSTNRINNVELHRQPTLCMPSPAMSNSIYSQSPVNDVELRHGELSSCAIYTLNTCNLLPRGLVLRPIQRKRSFQVELPVRADSTHRVHSTIPDEP